MQFDQCLFFATNALARSINRLAEENFSPLGLGPSYAFLLMAVNSRPGISPGELSQTLYLSPSTVTRLVEKMEKQGYLERDAKGRSTQVFPTHQSMAIDENLHQAWQQLSNRLLELFGPEICTEITGFMGGALKKIA